MKKMPNILFLMSDEHRFDVAGFAGNKIVRTKNLDWLAEDGCVFNNAYTPSPVCVPGRQSILAGQLPKTCKCEGWFDLEPGYLTIPRYFSQNSYYTIAAGKLHHEGIDQMQGWIQRIGNDMKISPRFIENKNIPLCKENSRPFHETKWSDPKEIQEAKIGKAFHNKMDEYTVKGTIDFIDEYFLNSHYDREKLNHQSLFLKVSLLQPHYPYTAEEEKFNYYLNRVPLYENQKLFDHEFLSQKRVVEGIDATRRQIQKATAAYYAMVEKVDDLFGEVLESLRNAGQNLDEWIIIYTTDHGDMLGEHGVWEKQKFFEGSVKVPLIIRWPEKFKGNKKIFENVSLCDLYATLCEMCDLPTPENLDSRSLVPLMKDQKYSWNNEVISQFSKYNQPLMKDESEDWENMELKDYRNMNLMIKKDELKYQYYGPKISKVLFDLKVNPEETINFINDSRYSEVITKFRKRASELGFGENKNKNYINVGYNIN